MWGQCFDFPPKICSIYTQICAYMSKMALTLVDYYASVLLEVLDERPSCSTVKPAKKDSLEQNVD